ncbi:MAG TPA: hypothetical protein VFR05_07985 [Terriglobia bacterium]|nr:hypothetical protein [Terriglobia bacterium]
MDDDSLDWFFDPRNLTGDELEKLFQRIFDERAKEWEENPEPGLVLRADVRERLLQQQQAVRDGQRGRRLEEFLYFETGWWEDAVLEIEILPNVSDQLIRSHPEFMWHALDRIYRLRPKDRFYPEPLRGGMVGIFKVKWDDYRILYLPVANDVIVICDISRASDLFEPARAKRAEGGATT